MVGQRAAKAVHVDVQVNDARCRSVSARGVARRQAQQDVVEHCLGVGTVRGTDASWCWTPCHCCEGKVNGQQLRGGVDGVVVIAVVVTVLHAVCVGGIRGQPEGETEQFPSTLRRRLVAAMC